MNNSFSQTRRRPAKGRRGKNNKQQRGPRNQNLITSSGKGASLTRIIEPWMPIFPARVTKWLRYSTNVALASASGVVATNVFRANDLFDPEFTGTGHQPMGFDQLMLWYNHFVVLKVRMVCTFKNTTSTSPTICLRQDGDSTPITVIDRIVELGGCTMDQLDGKNVYGDSKQLSISLDIAKLQGVARSAITSDPSLQGNAAASPAEVSYIHIQMWDSVGVSGTCTVDVILEQEAVFLEPRNLTPS